ncbi:MAG: hypothetical protein LQ343_003851 [Gyalolechia ehrenbergii]|nr:MAG: hypothetical protein LQ343_003851 [Gyalolechia ehrenbergii]
MFHVLTPDSHCGACKSVSGGESTFNSIIPKSNFNLTKGTTKTYTYTGNPVHCYYCPNCTSHVYHHQTVLGADKIVIRTVMLEGSADFPVGFEIYGKDRLKWQPELAQTVPAAPPA